jgi:hypothetical protein
VYDVPMPVDLAHWLTFLWVAALSALAGTVLGVAVSALPGSHRVSTKPPPRLPCLAYDRQLGDPAPVRPPSAQGSVSGTRGFFYDES